MSLYLASPLAMDERAISGMVLDAEHPPGGSGILIVWARIAVLQDASWKEIALYTIYLDESMMPPVGRHCTFHYHVGELNGIVKRAADMGKEALIADEFRCDPPSRQPL